MSKSLNMVFNTAQGKKVSININNPKENLTKEQVTHVMNSIIAKNIFYNDNGDFSSIAEINIKNTDKIALV